jgi:hypothetical protein
VSSRKKKGKRKKDKQARRRRLGRAARALPGDTMIVVSPPGQAKMSEVLVEFLEPYSEHWRTVEEFRKLVSVGAVAWNAALLPRSEREAFLQEMVQAVPPEVRQDMRSIVEEMIHRKETYFADNKRAIVNYEIAMTPAGPHLSVISSLG